MDSRLQSRLNPDASSTRAISPPLVDAESHQLREVFTPHHLPTTAIIHGFYDMAQKLAMPG
jgi:hypothetical protein